MSVKYLRSLLSKKERIQQEIDNETRAPQPDWARVAELKKRRLSLKDRIYGVIAGRSQNGRPPAGLRPRFQ
jgi:hypothetical protein